MSFEGTSMWDLLQRRWQTVPIKQLVRRMKMSVGQILTVSVVVHIDHCCGTEVSIENCNGGSRLDPGGTGPQNLAQAPKFLIGSIVISLSRCYLPNDEGPGSQKCFHWWTVGDSVAVGVKMLLNGGLDCCNELRPTATFTSYVLMVATDDMGRDRRWQTVDWLTSGAPGRRFGRWLKQ